MPGKTQLEIGDRDGRVAEYGRHEIGGRLAAKRDGPGRHLVEDDPEGEDVGTGIDGLALHLLGRHVGHRADQPSFTGEGACESAGIGDPGVRILTLLLGQSEVEDGDLAGGTHHDIGRLQIAVRDPTLVGGGQGIGDGYGHLQQPVDGKAALPGHHPSDDPLRSYRRPTGAGDEVPGGCTGGLGATGAQVPGEETRRPVAVGRGVVASSGGIGYAEWWSNAHGDDTGSS